ncbi:MAG: hypothetical protein WEB04_08635 [Dehalococcoidia bacterium]
MTKAAVRLFVARTQPFEDFLLFDQGRELVAAQAFVDAALKGADSRSLIAVSYPANGKRALLQGVCNRLSMKNLNVLWVDARELMLHLRDQRREEANALGRFVLSEAFRPLVVAIDDVDTLERAAFVDDVDTLESQTSSEDVEPTELLKRIARGLPNVVVLASAEGPGRALELLPGSTLIYFGWPDKDRMSELLADMKLPNHAKVAEGLVRIEKGLKARFTTSSLVGAVREAQGLYTQQELNDLNPVKLADYLSHFCSPTPEAAVSAYESENEKYRLEASRFLKGSDA